MILIPPNEFQKFSVGGVVSIFDVDILEKIKLLSNFTNSLSLSVDKFSVLYKSIGDI